MKLTTNSKIVQQGRLIVEAAEKGLEIQERNALLESRGWTEPSFGRIVLDTSGAAEYRIKPEPKIVTADMVRMAVHLCPLNMPHLDRMRWMADYIDNAIREVTE